MVEQWAAKTAEMKVVAMVVKKAALMALRKVGRRVGKMEFYWVVN